MHRCHSRVAVPVPALLAVTARLFTLRENDLRGAVALITAIAVVRGIYFGAPHIGVVALEAYHPAVSPMDSECAVVIDTESVPGGSGLDAGLLEDGQGRLVLSSHIHIGSGQIGIGRKSPPGQIAHESELRVSLDIAVRNPPAERMPAAHSDAPFPSVGIVVHRHQSLLEVPARPFVKLELHSSCKSYERAHTCERSDGICRIMTSVMEGCAVHLDPAQSPVSVAERPGSPSAESPHISEPPCLRVLKHRRYHPRVVEGMEGVQDPVSGLFIRHSGLLQPGPVGKGGDVVLQSAGLRKRLPENPQALVQVADLVAVVMVRTLSASIGEALIQSMIHSVYHLAEIGGVARVEIIQGIPIDYLLNEADSHLPRRIVELVVAQQRRADYMPVGQSPYSVFVNMRLSPLEQRAGSVFGTRIARGGPFVQPLLHSPEHFPLRLIHRCELGLGVLLPFPQPAPLPHVSLQMAVVVGNLHVRSDLGVQTGAAETDPVYVDGALGGGFRRAYDHPGGAAVPLLRPFVPVIALRRRHIDIFHPYRPPSRMIHVEVEMADFPVQPVVESESQRTRRGGCVVDPHDDAGSVHFHRGLQIRMVGEHEFRFAGPGESDGLPAVLEPVGGQRQRPVSPDRNE